MSMPNMASPLAGPPGAVVRRAYGVLAWGLIALGTVHIAATWRFFDSLTSSALWFFSGGLVMILSGALNLLNRSYGAIAPGLRWVCRGTNAVMLAFSGVMGVVTHASALAYALVLGLTGALTLLSVMPPERMAVYRGGPRTRSL